jgi:hypothetical protein
MARPSRIPARNCSKVGAKSTAFFSMTQDSDLQQDIREVLLRDLKKRARAFQKLKGGRNSRVFRVDCDDDSAVAVKAYFQSAQDQRDRMGNEFRAFQFLKSEGLRKIPAPLATDAARRIAIYELVTGQPLRAEEIGEADIDQAVEFLWSLKNIADSGKGREFSGASEACFSIEAILKNIDERFRRLDEASADEPVLAGFLRNEITPFRKIAGQRCHEICREHGIDPAAEIPMSERTLSPSDFGFHNALRVADGRLVFLDFEYFGWDDPAKTVADFLLHPGMQLSPALKQHFFSSVIVALAGVPKLRHRVRAVYPLFGLKWCAILLNEFTLENLARRCFADGTKNSWNKTTQLEKARHMLAQVINDHHNFPGSS